MYYIMYLCNDIVMCVFVCTYSAWSCCCCVC